jgi:hypothetical protein
MSVKLSRRETFALIAGGSIAQFPLSASGLPIETVNCFIHQSGKPSSNLNSNNDKFVLGMLTTKDEASCRRKIAELRQKYSYKRVIMSRSTDMQKVDICCAIIDYVLMEDDLRFCGALIKLSGWPDEAEGRDAVFFSFHKLLIDVARLPANSQSYIRLVRTEKLSTRYLARSLSNQLNGHPNVSLTLVAEDDLIQIAGLLSGVIRLGLTTEIESKARKAILQHALKTLNLEHFDINALVNHPRFKVREILI